MHVCKRGTNRGWIPNTSQTVDSPTDRTGGLTKRIPPLKTPYDLGLHHHVDTSFLSSFTTPPLPHLPTFTAAGPSPDNGWVVLDSLPPENEESYAKGWYSGFTEESQAAGAESSQVSDVEAICKMATGQSESLGFIKSNSHAAADERQDDSHEFSVFVANLAAEVTDYILEETFKGARVVTDRTTGRSKGYGYVRFADRDEQMRSPTELNGQYCLTRPMPAFQSFLGTRNESDPNTTVGKFGDVKQHRVFVAGLDSNITEENLRQIFSQFGELSHVKIHEGKGCGTVQFDNRACAEEAMVMLHGSQLGGSNIRLSWACSPSNEQGQPGGMVQQHADPNQRPAAAGNMYRYDGSYADYGKFLANVFSFQGCAGPEYGYQQHQQQPG
ncbi:hypothetical protein C5167_029632 [Papaver somniferum]|nr:hypothetical protein C5167_029632 [Papaver somniferum]